MMLQACFVGFKKKMHFRKVTMVKYNRNSHIRPLVTHFVDGICKKIQ